MKLSIVTPGGVRQCIEGDRMRIFQALIRRGRVVQRKSLTDDVLLGIVIRPEAARSFFEKTRMYHKSYCLEMFFKISRPFGASELVFPAEMLDRFLDIASGVLDGK